MAGVPADHGSLNRPMRQNRSIPSATVIPVLRYPDLSAAVQWLGEAFGFAERMRIPGHRVQMTVPGGGAVVAVQAENDAEPAGTSVMIRIDDVDAHHARSTKHGARVTLAPETFPFGERQYSVIDIGGHKWTFTQTVADVAPEEWGGQSVNVD